MRQNSARLDRHRVRIKIDLAHRAHAAQRHHDFIAAARRDLTADKARVASLRHNGSARLAAGFQDCCYLLRRSGLDGAKRMPVKAAARLAQEDLHRRRTGDDVLRANNCLKLRPEPV